MMPENDLRNSIQSLRVQSPKIGEVFTWERPMNNPGILALIRPAPHPLWQTELLEEDESEEEDDGNGASKFDSYQTLELCDVSDEDYEDGDDGAVRQVGKTKRPRFTKFTAIRENGFSPTGLVGDHGTAYPSSKRDSFTSIGNAGCDLNLGHTKRRRFGLFQNQNHLSKEYAGPEERLLPFHDMSVNTVRARNNGWLLFRAMANIPNPAVFKCKRFHIRRNAICDPFNLLMPQKTREKTEREAVQRKSSVFRRLQIFFRVKFGIEGEEDL